MHLIVVYGWVAQSDIHQCVIYDSKEAPARLLGIEYIINNETYQTLPAEEKKSWHPHAYEIVSGQLIVPDLADMGDKALEDIESSHLKRVVHNQCAPQSRGY